MKQVEQVDLPLEGYGFEAVAVVYDVEWVV